MSTLMINVTRKWRPLKLGFGLALSGVVIVLSLMLLIYPAITICIVVTDSQLNRTGQCRLVPRWFESAAGRFLSWANTYQEKKNFWTDARWLAGFTEMPRQSHDDFMDVDSGPVLCGIGSVSSAFGIGAAKTAGRIDQTVLLVGLRSRQLIIPCYRMLPASRSVCAAPPRICATATHPTARNAE